MKNNSINSLAEFQLPAPGNQTPLLTLVWLKQDSRQLDARRIVENVLRHSCGPYGLTAITGGDSRLAWGMLSPDKFAALTCWSVYEDGPELCLVEGDFYDDLPALKLQPGNNPDLALHVALQMRNCPDRRITDVIGIYSGVYVNGDRSCAYAFGDLTGTRLLYWLSDEKQFVVTNNLWAFRGCDSLNKRWDPMALSEMLTIGFPLAGRTWISGVRQLQRGRQVRSFTDGRTQVRMLLDPVERQPWSLKQSVHTLREGLDETVQRIYRRLACPIGLGLSGGLDSRTLLASLHSQKIDHCNFTFCIDREEPDNRIAKSAAALLGEQHETIVCDSPLPITHIEYRLINEGESPGFGFLLLAAYAQQYSNVLFIGNEAVRETAGSFQPLNLKSKRDLASCMLSEYLKFFTAEQVSSILTPDYSIPWTDVLDEWQESFEQIDQPTVMDVFLDHVADYRVQRRTRPRLEAARWYCLPVYPFMDERIYNVYRRLPLSHLHAEQAPLALLCDYKTGLEKLPPAARHFGLPMHRGYRYRHLIHFGHVLQEKVVPLRQKWYESMGRWGFGNNVLNATRRDELRRLEHCDLFHGPAVRNLRERAQCGTFVNRDAITRVINAGVINEFLFGSGFTGDRALSFLQPTREIQFLRSFRANAQSDIDRTRTWGG